MASNADVRTRFVANSLRNQSHKRSDVAGRSDRPQLPFSPLRRGIWGSIAGCLAGVLCASCGPTDDSAPAPQPANQAVSPEETPQSQATQAPVKPSASPESAKEQAETTLTLGDLPALLSAEEIQEGWIELFDGKTLFGWKANNDVNWSVADGVIQADKGQPGLLLTSVPFADFELLCDFRMEADGNSGVFLRSVLEPTDPSKDCYELNICDSHPAFPTGCLVGRVKTDMPVNGEGGWKTFHVRMQGAQITVKLDGEVILDHTDESDAKLDTGYIGLQKNVGKIEFRNVLLRPLGTEPIFNGTDLTGWRQVPGGKSEFAVEEGAIHVANGPGFLETEQTWSNFVLQAAAITNGTHLNSGIFFRALPGTEAAPSHGYELQIQNGFLEGDRSKPMDHGTGAIFRRAKARLVVPNDREWFYLTLIAHGPTFTAWVNGIPVTNWTDERDPSDNPRKGKKLEAGHISLQGHDPTTDLAFKDLRVATYPE